MGKGTMRLGRDYGITIIHRIIYSRIVRLFMVITPIYSGVVAVFNYLGKEQGKVGWMNHY